MLIALYAIIAFIVFLTIIGWNKGVPVLRYAQVNTQSSISPSAFEEELQWLSAHKYNTATISEWYQAGVLSSKTVLLTFDGGYYDHYTYVFPLLKKYNTKATFFLNTAYLPQSADRSTFTTLSAEEARALATQQLYKKGDGATNQFLSHAEIKEMIASGLCDFQAHSHTHKPAFKKPEFIRYVDAQPNAEDYHLYGAATEPGFPIFRSKGETSLKAFIPHPHYAKAVQEMLWEEWHELLEWQQKVEAAAFGVAAELKDMGRYETEEEFTQRVKKEIALNTSAIQKITGKSAIAYAWPYGDASEQGRKIIETEGLKIFLKQQGGTNARRPDWHNIHRIKVHKPSMDSFVRTIKWNSHRLGGFLSALFC